MCIFKILKMWKREKSIKDLKTTIQYYEKSLVKSINIHINQHILTC